MKKTVPFLLLVILFAVAAWYSMIRDPDPVHELQPPTLLPEKHIAIQPPEPDDSLAGVEPLTVPEPLPPLNDSDAAVTDAMTDLTGVDPFTEYLVKDQVISRVVATIDSLTSRQVPAVVNPIKPVEGELQVQTDAGRLVLSGDNFARYDDYVALLQELSTEDLLATYQHFSPLFQQAWEENGGKGPFEDRLLEVIDELLTTPDPEGFVYLSKPEAVYVFEDPELEALSAGQKILIRMGGANASLVKEKLSALKSGLSPKVDPNARHPRT